MPLLISLEIELFLGLRSLSSTPRTLDIYNRKLDAYNMVVGFMLNTLYLYVGTMLLSPYKS